MRRTALLPVAMAALTLIAAQACKPVNAAPPPEPGEVMIQSVQDAPDSTCFGFMWGASQDSLGTIDYYRLLFNVEGDTNYITQKVKDTQTWQCFPKHTPGDTVTRYVAVAAVRHGVMSEARIQGWTWVDEPRYEPPPMPGPIIIDSSEARPVGYFAEARALSPHFDFISRTFTDFCYCWDRDTSALTKAATVYDLEMSGNRARWKALNPSMTTLGYTLLMSTLDEANKDGPSLTGKFLDDMRTWYAAHPQYKMEDAFLHQPGQPADSAHRLNPHIWSTNRFFGNPTDSGWIAYTVDRYRRIVSQPGTDGVFIDEMDPPNLSWVQRSAEFTGKDTLVAQNAVIDLVKRVRAAIAPRMVQVNAAGYSPKDYAKRIGIAAGSMHLELMNLATQEQPSVWNLIDELLGTGTYLDYVGAETWQDMDKPTWEVKYPGGNYAHAVYRTKIQQLANYYMVVPSNPQKLGLQIDNVRNTVTPDSADLKIYYFNVGHPKEPRSVWLDTRDPLKQRARVFIRRFDNAVVLNRPVVYWADTVFRDTTKVNVPLPEGGGWTLVRANGDFVALDSLWLRNGESAIIFQRPTSEAARLQHRIDSINVLIAQTQRDLRAAEARVAFFGAIIGRTSAVRP